MSQYTNLRTDDGRYCARVEFFPGQTEPLVNSAEVNVAQWRCGDPQPATGQWALVYYRLDGIGQVGWRTANGDPKPAGQGVFVPDGTLDDLTEPTGCPVSTLGLSVAVAYSMCANLGGITMGIGAHTSSQFIRFSDVGIELDSYVIDGAFLRVTYR